MATGGFSVQRPFQKAAHGRPLHTPTTLTLFTPLGSCAAGIHQRMPDAACDAVRSHAGHAAPRRRPAGRYAIAGRAYMAWSSSTITTAVYHPISAVTALSLGPWPQSNTRPGTSSVRVRSADPFCLGRLANPAHEGSLGCAASLASSETTRCTALRMHSVMRFPLVRPSNPPRRCRSVLFRVPASAAGIPMLGEIVDNAGALQTPHQSTSKPPHYGLLFTGRAGQC
jgi:hypothetical protein